MAKKTKKPKLSRKAVAIKFAKPDKILSYDSDFIKKLNDLEYKIYLSRLANIANNRAKRTLTYSKNSYAVNKYYIEGGKFGRNKSKDRQSMIKEVNRINNFLRNKSSTIEGMEEIRRKGEKTIYNNTGLVVNLSGEYGDYYYKIYNYFRSNLPEEIFRQFYEEITNYSNMMADFMSKGIADENDILRMAEEYSTQLYKLYREENLREETEEEKEVWDEVDEVLNKRKKYGY